MNYQKHCKNNQPKTLFHSFGIRNYKAYWQKYIKLVNDKKYCYNTYCWIKSIESLTYYNSATSADNKEILGSVVAKFKHLFSNFEAKTGKDLSNCQAYFTIGRKFDYDESVI